MQRFSVPKASGNLRLGLVDYFVPDMLTRICGHFVKQYPDVHLEVQTGVGMNLIPLYEQGKLDIVVAGRDAYRGNCRTLMRDQLIWTVGRDYEIRANKVLSLVMLPAPCHFRKVAIEALEKAGREWKVVFTGTSIASVQAAVRANLGISVFPTRSLHPKLHQIPPELGLPKLPTHEIALFSDEKTMAPAKQVFTEYLELELPREVQLRKNWE
jgi:DNA-binding transcriptional LysR family regulator